MGHEEIEADNLVERYVLGRLPPDEQVRFEEHFAGCRACVEQLELAGELNAGIREAAGEDTRLVIGGGVAALLARHRRWITPFAIVFLALPAVWLAIQNQRLRGDLTDLQRPLANVPTFLLAVARDAATPVPTLEVPAGQPWLTLSVEVLSIEAELGVESYTAVLEDVAGRVLWWEEALEPNLWDVLLVTLPRALLPPGEYRLVLQATNGGTVGEPAVTYPFRID